MTGVPTVQFCAEVTTSCPSESMPLTTKEPLPLVVGIPEITPVAAAMLSPAGNEGVESELAAAPDAPPRVGVALTLVVVFRVAQF